MTPMYQQITILRKFLVCFIEEVIQSLAFLIGIQIKHILTLFKSLDYYK